MKTTTAGLRPTLALLLLCLLPAGGWAAVDLYAAEVPVASDAADERNRAIGAALSAVLVKVTGSRAVTSRPGVDGVLAEAPGMVQQYRYRLDPAAPDGGGRLLWVRFDPQAVERAVAGQGWPVWRQARPRLLVWLGADRAGRRSLLSPEAAPELAAALRAQGEARGLAVQWPLMDLEDQARLTPADLWSGFEAAILEASRRYGEGPVLVGRLSARTGGGWRPEWTLYDRGGAQRFAADSGDLAAVLRAGVDQAGDLLAARFGPVPVAGGQAPARVRLSGVATLADYAAILQLLGQVPGVSRIALRAAAADTLSFDVWLSGAAGALADALGADPRVQPQPAAPDAAGAAPLAYYWAD